MYKVLYKSNPKIDQWSLWGQHKKKEDAIEHAETSAKRNKGYQFKVVAPKEITEVAEKDATMTEGEE